MCDSLREAIRLLLHRVNIIDLFIKHALYIRGWDRPCWPFLSLEVARVAWIWCQNRRHACSTSRRQGRRPSRWASSQPPSVGADTSILGLVEVDSKIRKVFRHLPKVVLSASNDHIMLQSVADCGSVCSNLDIKYMCTSKCDRWWLFIKLRVPTQSCIQLL